MNSGNGEPQTSSRRPEGLRLTPFRSIIMIAVVVGIAVAISLLVDEASLGPEYELDLRQYRATDPALVMYKEASMVRAGLQEVRGIAVGGDDSIYVAGDRSICVFDAGGVKKADVPTGGARPQCVAVHVDGSIYVGMTDHVEVYDAGGARLESWQSFGEKAVLTSIAVAEDDVLVADAGNRVILRCDKDGAVLRRIGRKDEKRNIPGLVVPSAHLDVAMGSDGLLRVSNPGRRRIEAYTLGGDLEFFWGESSFDVEGFSGCCNPTDFALLPGGEVVTSEKGLPRVKVYKDVSGEFIGVVAGPEAFVQATAEGVGADFVGFDLAVDSKGRILVLDPALRAVRIFERKPKTNEKQSG